MTDNVTATIATPFISWGIPIIAAFLGATIALVGREVIEWYKRPRLEIDFEERDRIKPYIIEQNDYIGAVIHGPSVARMKFLRLKVHNKGKQPANYCEAKLSLTVANEDAPTSTTYLHWARRDLLLYTRDMDISQPVTDYEKAYAPIDINRGDTEYLEVLRVSYWYQGNKEPEILKPEGEGLTSASIPTIALVLQPNVLYNLTVTVFSSNAAPASKDFKVKWDGTKAGFAPRVVQS